MTLPPLMGRIARRLREVPQRGFPTLWGKADASSTLFDQQWGVETGKVVWWTNPWAKNYEHGTRYEGCDPRACAWAIESTNVELSQFCFVDVGCGKGRALIVASRYPFGQLIGVEYSKSLCQQALSNLDRIGAASRLAEIACMDAADFRFPEHDLIAYFYNPFDAVILDSVMSNLFPVARRHSLFVIWAGPNPELVAKYDWLKLFADDGHHTRVFQAISPSPTK